MDLVHLPLDVRFEILYYLEPLSIFCLSRTCKSMYTVLDFMKLTRWNINLHLSKFVDKPLDYRSMLGRCGAVVSGSSALQFLDGVFYEGSDTDVYFSDSKSVAVFGDYLVESEGYGFESESEYEQPSEWLGMSLRLIDGHLSNQLI